MSEASRTPCRWEVWHARFNFSTGKGYKYRPVIVLHVQESKLLVMMVTGASNKLKLPHDYHLKEWKEAGLVKPSVARADMIAEIPEGYLGTAGYMGRITDKDRSALSAILSSMGDGDAPLS